MNRPSSITVNLMSTNVAAVAVSAASPSGSLSADDKRQELIGGGSLLSSGIAEAGPSQAPPPPSPSKCDASFFTSNKDTPSASSASPSPSSALKMPSSKEASKVENLLEEESAPATATATATVTAKSDQANAESTNNIIEQDEPTTDPNHEQNDNDGAVTSHHYEESVGRLRLDPPPRPSSSSDRYAARQGRDVHHLAFAVDLLRDLDMMGDDDEDSDDDDDEMHHLPQ